MKGTICPQFIILPTRRAIEQFEQHMATLTRAEYDLSEVASLIIEAIQSRDHIEYNLTELINWLIQQMEEGDTYTVRLAVSQLTQHILSFIEPLHEAWDKKGEFHYQFHSWQGRDMVLAHLPLALPNPEHNDVWG